MKKFTITNGENQEINVELVRYFKFKNDLFLIYTMNEMDEKNYIKLYLVRIMEELGFPVVQTIRNDADWALMQGIVKKVLKEIKSGKRKLLEDMDYSDIVGIKIVNPRYFKLEPKLAEILASNYLDSNEIQINTQDSLNNVENSVDNSNESVTESLNVNSSVIPLESIDATIEKEGKFEPIVDDNYQKTIQPIDVNNLNDNIQNIDNTNSETVSNEPIQPIEINNLDNNTAVIELNVNEQKNIIESTVDVQQIENKTEENTTILEPISEIVAIENLEQENNLKQEENDGNQDNIDYKSLYMAVKKENETSSALIDNLMSQLLKYKEKFGNLEENIEN